MPHWYPEGCKVCVFSGDGRTDEGTVEAHRHVQVFEHHGDECVLDIRYPDSELREGVRVEESGTKVIRVD